LAKRYDQMLALIEKVKPIRIVEIGVHHGIRAHRLCRKALELSTSVRYTGYDVFDTMTAEFQEAALNGKGMPSETEARSRLDQLKPDLKYELVIGDTRDTLHRKSVEADFCFIDGDHRVDAVRGDYLALASSNCIVFDDYYRADKRGAMPDLTKYGANQVIEELSAKGMRVEILPHGDTCKHGGVSYLAVVWN